MNTLKFSIPSIFDQKKLRVYLNYFHLSKSNIYKLELNKQVTSHGEVLRSDDVLHEGQHIEIHYEPELKTMPFQGDIDILYEDDDFLIVNKPAYLLVHTDGQTIDTLTNRVQFHYQEKDIEIDAYPVHRIDFETSGMIVFAKHFLAQSYFSYLFEAQEINKYYVCVCRNPFVEKEGIIREPIGKDRHTSKQIVSPTGKDAETKFKVIKEIDGQTKVLVEIAGGRKHQIRVHMAYINHPIVGDKLYGVNDYNRMLLHFKRVEFTHPRTMERFVFESNEPF
ncbi:MAG: RluA family pseudouridine synthase [Acholeplasmataceae bacterium]|jgi:23S rRNA pseudouridine1911/1915/1917 synthase|nr:RluA family pseudouridine synthase [Acholeplasmataceae bacterium]